MGLSKKMAIFFQLLALLTALLLFATGCGVGAPTASAPPAPAPPASAAPAPTPPASSAAPPASTAPAPPTAPGTENKIFEEALPKDAPTEGKDFAGAPSIAPPVTPPTKPPVPPQAGLLTAGEWNDNNNWGFFQGILSGGQDWSVYQQSWSLTPTHRITVRVTSDGQPLQGATVTLLDAGNQPLFRAVSDHTGTAQLFFRLFGDRQERAPAQLSVTLGQHTATQKLTDPAARQQTLTVALDGARSPAPALDLMLVFDTTGSMQDELAYLQAELEGVVKRVSQSNANLPIRLSVNFYRDVGDAYVLRPYPFTTNISASVGQLRQQESNGGGDFPEAVEQALQDAIHNHQWSQESVKLMLLILDAPPHNTPETVSTLQGLTADAAQQGIRIIPVASSGIDKQTEFLLRTLAATTGGTYVFLTDDSGVGGSHLEPTIGDYTVERLDNLLVNIINRYLHVGFNA